MKASDQAQIDRLSARLTALEAELATLKSAIPAAEPTNYIDPRAIGAVILGGRGNAHGPQGEFGVILSGESNYNNGEPGNVIGGNLNRIVTNVGYSVVFGGMNAIDGNVSDYYTIIGGRKNTAGWKQDLTPKSFMNIWGGERNNVANEYTWIVGCDIVNDTAFSIEFGFSNDCKVRVDRTGLRLVGTAGLTIQNGAGPNKVLASDDNGNARWVSLSELET